MMTGEPRRIELTHVDATEKEKQKEKHQKTVRFNLTLTESSETACPEFSYSELLKNVVRDEKKEKVKSSGDPLAEINTDDPFAAQDEAEHEKMVALAKSFEAKYGGGSRGRKRQDRIQDLVDLGEGYDEADPFIDNTEAYDEIVPACLTTKFGGFYINSGLLDFRETSDNEDVAPSFKKKKKNKRITSDDEGDRSNVSLEGKKRGRKKKFKEDGEIDPLRKKRKKWSISTGEAAKIMKKRKLGGAKLGRSSTKKKSKQAHGFKKPEDIFRSPGSKIAGGALDLPPHDIDPPTAIMNPNLNQALLNRVDDVKLVQAKSDRKGREETLNSESGIGCRLQLHVDTSSTYSPTDKDERQDTTNVVTMDATLTDNALSNQTSSIIWHDQDLEEKTLVIDTDCDSHCPSPILNDFNEGLGWIFGPNSPGKSQVLEPSFEVGTVLHKDEHFTNVSAEFNHSKGDSNKVLCEIPARVFYGEKLSTGELSMTSPKGNLRGAEKSWVVASTSQEEKPVKNLPGTDCRKPGIPYSCSAAGNGRGTNPHSVTSASHAEKHSDSNSMRKKPKRKRKEPGHERSGRTCEADKSASLDIQVQTGTAISAGLISFRSQRMEPSLCESDISSRYASDLRQSSSVFPKETKQKQKKRRRNKVETDAKGTASDGGDKYCEGVSLPSSGRDSGLGCLPTERAKVKKAERKKQEKQTVDQHLVAPELLSTRKSTRGPDQKDWQFKVDVPSCTKSKPPCIVGRARKSPRGKLSKKLFKLFRRSNVGSTQRKAMRLSKKDQKVAAVTPTTGSRTIDSEPQRYSRPKIKHTPTVAELIKRQRQSTTNGLDKTISSAATASTDSRLLYDLGDFGLGQLDAATESVINSVLNESSGPPGAEDSSSLTPDGIPPLPAGLSPQLEDSVTKIIQAAKESLDGKCKFFKTSVNQLLLDIEMRCRQLSPGARNSVFTHLAAFLPCGKETLMKRAKKLRLDVDGSLREPVERLRLEISRVMPAQVENYAMECAVAAQRQQEERAENRELGTSESEDDRSNDVGITDKRRLPHKKFEWTPKIKALVNDIVRIKMESYDLLKERTQTPEEHLRAFLDAEIKPLWPKGWMQTRMIYKETRGTHFKWTNGGKVKRPQTVSVAKSPATSSTTAPAETTIKLDKLPRIDFDIDAPLPGGLASSGTEPISKDTGGLVISGTCSLTKVPWHGAEAIEVREEKLSANSTSANTSVTGSIAQFAKSQPSLQVVTSTPAVTTPNRTLLDYASDSFLSTAKSKSGVLSMGTVLPDTVHLATSSSPATGPFLSTPTASSVSANTTMMTPATDSLRNLSGMVKKEVADMIDHLHKGSVKSEQLPSPPARQTPSYQATSLSSRSGTSGGDNYMNQYKDFVGSMMQQQSPSPTSSSSATGPKPFESKKLSPNLPSAMTQKTNWDLQHLTAKTTSAGLSQAALASGPSIRSLSTSLSSSMSQRTPKTQTQVHQVSSSLNKTQVHQPQGLKVNIPGSSQSQGVTPSSRVSPGQSFTTDKQQRQVQGQNLSLTQRSPQSQNLTPQSRSYQASFHDGGRKGVSVSPRTSPCGAVGTSSSQLSPTQRLSPSIQGLHSSTTTSRQNLNLTAHTNLQRGSAGSSVKNTASVMGGGSVSHSPTKAMSSAVPMSHVPRSPQASSAFPTQRHSASPSSGSTAGSSMASAGHTAGTYKLTHPSSTMKLDSHNGGHGSRMSPAEASAAQANLSHLLETDKAAKRKTNTPPGGSASKTSPGDVNNDIVYSSLTMAQILATGPAAAAENRKAHFPQQQSGGSKAVSSASPSLGAGAEPRSPLWRTADSAAKQASMTAAVSTPYSMSTLNLARQSPVPSTGVFMTPTTTSLHSNMRMADLQRDSSPRAAHASTMQINRTQDSMMSPGTLPLYGHGSPAHSTPSPMSVTTPGPHHAHSPQTRVGTSSHVMPHPTSSPFGFTYPDPTQPQHRY